MQIIKRKVVVQPETFLPPLPQAETAGAGSSDGSTEGSLRKFLRINYSFFSFPWVWLADFLLVTCVDRLGINDMPVKRIADASIQLVGRFLKTFSPILVTP